MSHFLQNEVKISFGFGILLINRNVDFISKHFNDIFARNRLKFLQ